jgi:hypothetical protein
VWICNPGAGDYHNGFPTGRHYLRRIGRSSRCDQEELPRLASQKGCCNICQRQHQELWQAVWTHYGPTRIYGTTVTGHAIGGTAQQALQELLLQLQQPGLGTISDDYGLAAICRSMDLAAAAGARATSMS